MWKFVILGFRFGCYRLNRHVEQILKTRRLEKYGALLWTRCSKKQSGGTKLRDVFDYREIRAIKSRQAGRSRTYQRNEPWQARKIWWKTMRWALERGRKFSEITGSQVPLLIKIIDAKMIWASRFIQWYTGEHENGSWKDRVLVRTGLSNCKLLSDTMQMTRQKWRKWSAIMSGAISSKVPKIREISWINRDAYIPSKAAHWFWNTAEQRYHLSCYDYRLQNGNRDNWASIDGIGAI